MHRSPLPTESASALIHVHVGYIYIKVHWFWSPFKLQLLLGDVSKAIGHPSLYIHTWYKNGDISLHDVNLSRFPVHWYYMWPTFAKSYSLEPMNWFQTSMGYIDKFWIKGCKLVSDHASLYKRNKKNRFIGLWIFKSYWVNFN